MQIQAKSSDALKHKADALVIGIFEGKQLSETAASLDAESGAISKILSQEKFTGQAGASLTLLQNIGQSATRLVLLGLGKATAGEVSQQNFKTALGKLPALAKQYRHIALDLNGITVSDNDAKASAKLVAKTLATSLWQFSAFKTDKPQKPALQKLTLLCDKKSVAPFNTGSKEGIALASGINLARELGNLPGNVCTPTYLSKQARAMVRGHSEATVKVLSEKQMQDLGMGAFLSVSVGSDEPGQMIILEYRGGAKNKAPLALVGKGVTFDTGGISLKPGAGMDEMKFDMCGAASVLGTFQSILDIKPKINVVAVIAAAENMPSGNATKPGDIVTTMSGQTVEILNTDAEGRLVLCDALTYVQRYKPSAIVDVATLTGACVVALGSHAHGLYSNDEALAEKLLAAGKAADDKAWHMPLWDEYQKQLDSNFADMANIGGREAGSVTAACYLSRFVKDCKWAHLDIAGTAWKSGGAKGATGRPVSLLLEYLTS
ncbi:leucyl aminopeptidase [Gilvimarinus agarilyticus]|uniref:leucyl aminopeptidase n=1 Tax=unclassified Gilvimarinus TaxID=2642066 RepID=UPI001C0A0938|nr:MULTISPECIES: leucyl aminopeptidase [unclassified Gilvimarinus]MBU2887332.1 leucyl aminopeptidase [Gilvimarinus agarilyticus]MDO6571991.1 leucyl aminopeptidase [Gilvimarinus sp. 2_MG-2023]MDO6746059.1 leucyl aminopeptidase [Gilvimarinus sp. 1_MG-2023]